MTLGMMATDMEQRIDFEAMRRFKFERIQAQLEEKDLGGVICLIRTISGTRLPRLCQSGIVINMFVGVLSQGAVNRFYSKWAVRGRSRNSFVPWLKVENIQPGGGMAKRSKPSYR